LQSPTIKRAHKDAFANLIDSSKKYLHFSSPDIVLELNQNFSSNLWLNKSTFESNNILNSKVDSFKNHLISKLRRSESDLFHYLQRAKSSQNFYNVKFKGRKNSYYPSKKLLCNIPVILLKNIIQNFDSNLNQQNPIFNSISINDVFQSNGNKKRPTCAMVSNSGALIGSDLGQEIDSHDIVLRFNNAPTINYIDDVGNKTTIRVLNSQLLLNESFNISSSDLYRNIIKFVWDASDYDLDLTKWTHKRRKFFEAHQQLKKLFPNEILDIIHPELIWKSWDLLQSTTFTSMPKNPPSSGFLGIIILLKICSRVDIYEYIPSMRMNDKCHYYDNTINTGCTFGQWYELKL